MQTEEFWSLIEQARLDAAAGGTAWPRSSTVGVALARRLEQLPLERILAFDDRYTRVVAQADRWEICAAAFVIWDYISDNTLDDFKAGLIGLGRDTFERSTADPDTLAGHPMVQAMAAGTLDRFALGAEEIMLAACYAYQARSDDDDSDGFWQAAHAYAAAAEADDEAPGHRWDGDFGSTDDALRIPESLPQLYALFDPSASGRHRT